MAEAYMCDRCHNFYTKYWDSYPSHTRTGLEDGQFNMITTTFDHVSYETVRRFDLCPECKKAFIEFMKPSGVNFDINSDKKD